MLLTIKWKNGYITFTRKIYFGPSTDVAVILTMHPGGVMQTEIKAALTVIDHAIVVFVFIVGGT